MEIWARVLLQLNLNSERQMSTGAPVSSFLGIKVRVDTREITLNAIDVICTTAVRATKVVV